MFTHIVIVEERAVRSVPMINALTVKTAGSSSSLKSTTKSEMSRPKVKDAMGSLRTVSRAQTL